MTILAAADYSWERPTLDQLWAHGIRVIFRYVGPPEWGKTITQAEYDALIAKGFEVRLVFENGSNDAAGGSAAGVANATLALQYVPTGYTGPIYMAVDESVSGQLLAIAVSYIAGASSVLGVERTGDYGDGLLIEGTKAAGVADHHWLAGATAWPGYSTALPDATAVQGLTGPVPGTDADTVTEPTPAPPTPPALTKEPQMYTTDPTSGKVIATDAAGNLYAEPGIPGLGVTTLAEHPAWHAGTAANPCVGITSWKDPDGKWGYAYITQPASGSGGFGPYDLYHVGRDGTPH